MAEIVTVARPYAEAVFRLAKEQKRLNEWSEILGLLSAVSCDSQIRAVLGDPNVLPSQLEALFLSVCGKKLDETGKNFVKELVKNGRLGIIAQIAELFESLKAESGGELEAQVTSAFPMTDKQTGELVKNLESKFKKKVHAKVNVDPGLIGGVKIEIGDDVIDASVRAKLQAMAFALTR